MIKLHGKNASVIVFKNDYKKSKYLCIAAHQDDAEIMAYGQIAECYENGGFSALVLTDGAGSPRSGAFSGVSDPEMKKIRIEEQKRAAETGNYDVLVQLGYSSADVKNNVSGVEEDLASVILETKPDIILIHNLADKHDTHVASALRAISALKKIKDVFRPEKVYMMEVWRGLDWMNDSDKTLFDTSLYPDLAEKILNVYESQIAGGKEYTKAAIGRRFANATFLESHSVDRSASVSLGADITGFVYSDKEPGKFISEYIERFRIDVTDRIQKYK